MSIMICDECGKKTRKPKLRKGRVYCPRCFRAFLKRFVEMIRRA